MNDRLLHAPIGFLSLNNEGEIIRVNDYVLNITGLLHYEVEGISFQELLTLASRIYFQSYFLPTINLKGNISEMYVTLRAVKNDLPVVLNARLMENGEIDIYFLAVPSREGYVRKLIEDKEVMKRNT